MIYMSSTNRVDELMSLDPLDMTKEDLDEIVAYHRKNRALGEAGVKAKKETGPKVSLGNLLDDILQKPTQTPIARRKI